MIVKLVVGHSRCRCVAHRRILQAVVASTAVTFRVGRTLHTTAKVATATVRCRQRRFRADKSRHRTLHNERLIALTFKSKHKNAQIFALSLHEPPPNKSNCDKQSQSYSIYLYIHKPSYRSSDRHWGAVWSRSKRCDRRHRKHFKRNRRLGRATLWTRLKKIGNRLVLSATVFGGRKSYLIEEPSAIE